MSSILLKPENIDRTSGNVIEQGPLRRKYTTVELYDATSLMDPHSLMIRNRLVSRGFDQERAYIVRKVRRLKTRDIYDERRGRFLDKMLNRFRSDRCSSTPLSNGIEASSLASYLSRGSPDDMAASFSALRKRRLIADAGQQLTTRVRRLQATENSNQHLVAGEASGAVVGSKPPRPSSAPLFGRKTPDKLPKSGGGWNNRPDVMISMDRRPGCGRKEVGIDAPNVFTSDGASAKGLPPRPIIRPRSAPDRFVSDMYAYVWADMALAELNHPPPMVTANPAEDAGATTSTLRGLCVLPVSLPSSTINHDISVRDFLKLHPRVVLDYNKLACPAGSSPLILQNTDATIRRPSPRTPSRPHSAPVRVPRLQPEKPTEEPPSEPEVSPPSASGNMTKTENIDEFADLPDASDITQVPGVETSADLENGSPPSADIAIDSTNADGTLVAVDTSAAAPLTTLPMSASSASPSLPSFATGIGSSSTTAPAPACRRSKQELSARGAVSSPLKTSVLERNISPEPITGRLKQIVDKLASPPPSAIKPGRVTNGVMTFVPATTPLVNPRLEIATEASRTRSRQRKGVVRRLLVHAEVNQS